MKPYHQLTSRQKFIRKNSARLIIYGSFAFALIWAMLQVVEKQEEANFSSQHIEDTMMNYYRETREQTDTVGMASYMRQHLSAEEYEMWLEEGKRY